MKLFSPTLLGFSILAGMGISKFQNITPEYLQGVKSTWGEDSAESSIAQSVDSVYGSTGLYNINIIEIIPRIHGFEESIDLINSLLTYGLGTYLIIILLMNVGGFARFLFNRFVLIFGSIGTIAFVNITPAVFAVLFIASFVAIITIKPSA